MTLRCKCPSCGNSLFGLFGPVNVLRPFACPTCGSIFTIDVLRHSLCSFAFVGTLATTCELLEKGPLRCALIICLAVAYTVVWRFVVPIRPCAEAEGSVRAKHEPSVR